MVYGQIDIVLGIKISDFGAFTRFLGLSGKEYEEYVNDETLPASVEARDENDSPYRIWYNLCCNYSGNKDVVIGISISTIWRIKSRCDNCPEYQNCDDCFGQTDQGTYNFEKLYGNNVEVSPENLCSHCLYDLKESRQNVECCPRCNYKQDIRCQPWGYSIALRGLKKYLENIDLAEYPIKCYYFPDDCGSCT